MAEQFLGQAAALARGLLLFELVDEIDEVEEPSSSTATDDGGSDRL
jgi:hypothetical protein